MSEEVIEAISILGNQYSIKVPAAQQRTLQEAATLLKQSLAETKRLYPSLIGDKLLVLAALNLCSRQVTAQREHVQALAEHKAQVDATVAAIAQAIAEG
jgi:cell division protein ZapA